MTAPFDMVSFANGLLASQRPGKPRVEPADPQDWESRECRNCLGYGYFDAEGRVTLNNNCDVCTDCNGTGFTKPVATKCSGCQFNAATRRDAHDVADVCDICGEASDDHKRDREKRQRRMAEREEV